MNDAEIKKQMKAANPRKNCLLNNYTIFLRRKIKLKLFHMKQDLFRMNIKEIKELFCEYCDSLESTKKYESLKHILTEYSRLNEVWQHFRSGIKNKWNAECSDAEMMYGPKEKTQTKMKVEYTFLRIMNRFFGLRSEGNFNTDVVTPMKNTCDDILNLIEETFEGKFKKKKTVGNTYANCSFTH